MPNLFPTGYENALPTPGDIVEDKPIGYKPGIAFDYDNTGDFMRDGRNRVMESTGIESWRSWVINCLQTQRYKHLAYSTDFGIDIDAVFAATTHAEAESILVREITEAIMADDYKRTEYIQFIGIDWSVPDAVTVDFVLFGLEDVTLDMTVYITRGNA